MLDSFENKAHYLKIHTGEKELYTVEICKEAISLKGVLKEVKMLRRRLTSVVRRLDALEYANQERELEVANLQRRIQSDFPVASWEDDWDQEAKSNR